MTKKRRRFRNTTLALVLIGDNSQPQFARYTSPIPAANLTHNATVWCWSISHPYLRFRSIRKTDSPQQLRKARVVAERFHEGIDFQEANKLIGIDCFVECRKGP